MFVLLKDGYDNEFFFTCNEIKQGDVLRSLLLNSALGYAFDEWKEKLTNEDVLIDWQTKRLTNTRYADDIMSYGKCL